MKLENEEKLRATINLQTRHKNRKFQEIRLRQSIQLPTKKSVKKMSHKSDENFVRRKFCPKIKFYVVAKFDRLNNLQVWNIHIGLPSDVKPCQGAVKWKL